MRTSSASLVCLLAVLILTPAAARAAAPTALTLIPTNITTTSATLRGSVNPNGLATSARFQWGLTTNYGNNTTSQSVGSGAAPVEIQAPLSSLLTDTNYHYRLVTSSSGGSTAGSDMIVTPTLLLYLYAGESWSYTFHDLPYNGTIHTGFGGVSAENCFITIQPGSFLPGSSLLMEAFADSTNAPGFSRTNNAPATNTGIGSVWYPDLQGTVRFTALTGSVVIASLFFSFDEYQGSGNHAYYGNVVVPTRNPQSALLATQLVSAVSAGSAVVQANINAFNLPSGVYLQWGTTTNYGSATGAAYLDRDYVYPVTLTVSNLVPQTAYHLRTVVTNSAGATYGNDLTLTTPPAATAVTLPATGRTTNSALLNAAISLGGGFNVTAYFEWGLTTNYDHVTALQDLGNGTQTTNISAQLTGLDLITIYHCRALAYGLGVTNYGADLTFSTTPPPTNVVVTNLATDDVLGAMARGGKVTFACDGVLVLSNQVEIVSDLCLDAGGHAITLSGSNVTRIFKVRSGTTLCLTNLTLAQGRSTNGGAIYNEGIVQAERCRFVSNMVVGAAGIVGTNGLDGTNSNPATPGLPGSPGGAGQNVSGGAIFNSGALDLAHCFFATNGAVGGNGGDGGNGGRGGQSTVFNPISYADGGAGGNGGAAGTAKGGAIASAGLLRIQGCSFSNSFGAGGIGGKAGGGGYAYFPSAAVGPNGSGGAGGVAQGGAIFAIGQATVSNSVFAANLSFAGTGGAGVPDPRYGGPYGPAGGGSGAGGAIYWGCTGLVVNCTFATNLVQGGDAGFGSGFTNIGGNAMGGAIAGAGSIQGVNLTLHGNMAIGGSKSTYNFPVGTNGLSLGGSIANTGGVFQIVNSILSAGTSNNAWGTITDLGHNISSDLTPAWTSGTSLNNTDPLLLPLANNGGPTWTMALRVGSPALNAADCAAAPSTDQRGVARPDGPGCDIGAYEGAGMFSLQVWPESATTNVVRHAAEPGRAYRLEKTVLFDAWIPVVTNIAPAGGWLEFHIPATGSPCFYRVVAQ